MWTSRVRKTNVIIHLFIRSKLLESLVVPYFHLSRYGFGASPKYKLKRFVTYRYLKSAERFGFDWDDISASAGATTSGDPKSKSQEIDPLVEETQAKVEKLDSILRQKCRKVGIGRGFSLDLTKWK